MKDALQSKLERAARSTGHIVVGLILVQAITGILMSMYYVPSDAPARTVDGKPLTIAQTLRIDTVGTFIDTLNTVGNIALVPARAGEPVPSIAAASVHVSLENAPLGGFIRRMHQSTATALVIMSLIWAALLGFVGAYASNPRMWLISIGVAVLSLALAWTGRVLPDDIYSMISRTIVSNELREAPMGDFITRILGLHMGELSLSRTFILHALVMGGGLCVLAFRISQRSTADAVGYNASRKPTADAVGYGSIFVVAGMLALVNTLHEYPIRDAVRGVSGGEHVQAWWTIMPIHAWAVWLGAELAGILAIAMFVKLLTMPLWHSRMSPLYAKTLIAGISLALVVAYMFGN